MRFSHSNSFLLVSVLPFMVTNILHYKNGFLLTKCFQKQGKFCVVWTLGLKQKDIWTGAFSCHHHHHGSPSWAMETSSVTLKARTQPKVRCSMHSCNHVIVIIMKVHRERWRHHQWHQRWECSPRFNAQMLPHWRHLTAVLGSVLLFLKTLNALVDSNSPGAVVCSKGFPSSTSVLELTLSS